MPETNEPTGLLAVLEILDDLQQNLAALERKLDAGLNKVQGDVVAVHRRQNEILRVQQVTYDTSPA
jgi:hypothetical protein